ncbi:MAG: Ig-like domain-containing protein, partial [Planctomycetes bacterium]|nr:Ig-like domain-containing protein [Planctomycetota bacterium]
MKPSDRCKFYRSIILLIAASCSSLFADGPGLGNLTYTGGEYLSTLAVFDDGGLGGVGGVQLGQGFVTMHRGYLIVPFSADGGGGNGSGGVAVYDVSDPRNVSNVFTTIGNADYTISGDPNYIGDMREPHGYGVSGDIFCFSTNKGAGTGIEFWDFSDPLAGPEKVAKLVLPLSGGDYSSTTWWVFWQGGRYVYVAGTTAGLFIVDTTDLNDLSWVQIPTSSLGGFRINTVFAIGNLLVMAMSDGTGITTADIQDPMNPVVLQTLTAGDGDSDVGYSMMVNGDKILGADDPAAIWDISDPANITFVGEGQNVANKGGYGTFQDGIFHYGSSSKYVKLDLTQTDGSGNFVVLATNSPTGFTNPDWDFGTVLGNLVFQGNDHDGSALIVHDINPDNTGPEVNMVSPKDNVINQALTSRVGLTFTDQIDLSSVSSSSFIVRPFGGSAIAGTYSHQTGIVNFAPDSPLVPNTTYEIVIPVGGIRDFVGNTNTQPFFSNFSTGATISEFKVDMSPDPLPSILVGETVYFDANSIGNLMTVQYSWDFGDGSPVTPFSTTSTESHTYSDLGHYAVTVFARDGGPGSSTASDLATLTVYNPVMAVPPTRSTTIIYDEQTPTSGGQRVWVVNADNDTISALHTATYAKLAEIPVGDHPRTLAQAPDGRIWVTNQIDDTISLVNNVSETIDSTVALD